MRLITQVLCQTSNFPLLHVFICFPRSVPLTFATLKGCYIEHIGSVRTAVIFTRIPLTFIIIIIIATITIGICGMFCFMRLALVRASHILHELDHFLTLGFCESSARGVLLCRLGVLHFLSGAVRIFTFINVLEAVVRGLHNFLELRGSRQLGSLHLCLLRWLFGTHCFAAVHLTRFVFFHTPSLQIGFSCFCSTFLFRCSFDFDSLVPAVLFRFLVCCLHAPSFALQL